MQVDMCPAVLLRLLTYNVEHTASVGRQRNMQEGNFAMTRAMGKIVATRMAQSTLLRPAFWKTWRRGSASALAASRCAGADAAPGGARLE